MAAFMLTAMLFKVHFITYPVLASKNIFLPLLFFLSDL